MFVFFAYSPIFCKILFSFHIITIMGVIWFTNDVTWKKNNRRLYVFSKRLNVKLAGTSFSRDFFLHFSFLHVFVFLLVIVWHILDIERSQSLSMELKKISQWFHLMHNFSNQFEINSFKKNQCFNKLCPFSHLLSTHYQVALRKSPIFCSKKVKINFPIISFIWCHFDLFINGFQKMDNEFWSQLTWHL